MSPEEVRAAKAAKHADAAEARRGTGEAEGPVIQHAVSLESSSEREAAEESPPASTRQADPAASTGEPKGSEELPYLPPTSSATISMQIGWTEMNLSWHPDSNPFVTLGLDVHDRTSARKLSIKEIEAAYRRAALDVHPDRSAGDAAQFQALNLAKNTLIDDARRLWASEFWFPTEEDIVPGRSASSSARRVMPGLSLLQGSLQQALQQRSQAGWTRPQDQIVARLTKDQLRSIRGQPFRLEAEDRATAETAEEAKRRILTEKINSSVQRRLIAAVGRAGETKGTSIGALKRSARSWTRAAFHRERLKEEAAAARMAKAASTDATCSVVSKALGMNPDAVTTAIKEGQRAVDEGAREAWRRYRREQQDWHPPPAPKPRRSKPSAAAIQRKRLKRTVKSRLSRLARRSKGLLAIEDQPTGDDSALHAAPAAAEIPPAPTRQDEAASSAVQHDTTPDSEPTVPTADIPPATTRQDEASTVTLGTDRDTASLAPQETGASSDDAGVVTADNPRSDSRCSPM